MSVLQIELPEEVQPDEARFLLALKLLEAGRVSTGQAARMSGYTKRTFLELAGKRGFVVLDYPAADLGRETAL